MTVSIDDPTMENGASGDEAKARRPLSRTFRKTARTKMAPDQARRQGDITKLAFTTLGSAAAAMEFLNQPHAELGERPLDLATASDEGFAIIERLLRGFALPEVADT